MSTAKRLVLSLRGRKNSQGNSATSSTRLVSAGTSPGHELEEIAVVSGTGTSSHHFSYGGCIASSDAAASTPRYSTADSATSKSKARATPSLRRDAAIDTDAEGTNVADDYDNDNGLHIDVNRDADDDERWPNARPQAPPSTSIRSRTHAPADTANDRPQTRTTIAIRQNSNICSNTNRTTTATATATATATSYRLAPRASCPEIMQPRLSLNGLLNPSLMPSPRPLYRDHSSRSINPLTAYEQQMAELDGSFYASNAGYLGAGMGGSAGGATTCTNLTVGGGSSGAPGGGLSHGGGTIGGGSAAIHTTELSITPTMAADEQFIDLGSLRRFSIDRQSFLDLGPKFGMSQPKFGQSVSQQGFFTSHDSLATPCASRASNSQMATVSTASEMDLLHNKQRNKSRGRLKTTASGDQPLLGGTGTWNRSMGRGSQDNTLAGGGATSIPMGGHTQYGGNYCNGTDRYPRSRSQHQQPHHNAAPAPHRYQLQHSISSATHQRHSHGTSSQGGDGSGHHGGQSHQAHHGGGGCGAGSQGGQPHHKKPHRTASQRIRAATAARKLHFVFDPAGRLCYYWSMVVSMAFLYNFWVIIYRFAFQEINRRTIAIWFCLDYLSDFLYLIDIFFHFRTGYLEDGVLQTDALKLRTHYMNSTIFYIDCLCLLPLDFLYLSIGFNSILRSFRLVKIYRFWAFMDRTERHTNYPNLFRSTALIHYLLVIFHWNGCLYHIIHKNNGFGSRNWVYHDSESADVVKQYLQSYYWCTLALTTIGDLPKPRSKGEYVFVILQLLFGLMLFATVLGHVANIVTSVSAARKEFQAKLDGVKTYMRMRRVPNHLQVKVIKWFDYLWLTQKCSDEERAVSCLPDKLKAEIAINVHLDTLKRVEIFQNTEAGFLCELVLRLRPVLFSPGDYICRKGEVGKEMYIVNRGRLQVVADNGKTVMASLKAGSYFGEISILNMGTAGKELGNRRTASVRSVGYSDLFVLSKKDMWDVLKEYPAARVRLESIAVKRLEKYKKAPLEKVKYFNIVAMGRCQSTPGLVESCGRTSLEDMWLPPAPTPPAPLVHHPLTHQQHHQQHQPLHQHQPQATQQSSQQHGPRSYADRLVRATDSPRSVSPSAHGSEERPRSRAASHHSIRPQSQPSHTGHICDSSSQLECYGAGVGAVGGGTTPLLGSHEALEDEIKRLRERLHTVESENQALNTKLSQQQWDLENRLAEIEMQICGVSSTSSVDPENETEELERNRESII
ncbi:potassium/sodium hyperpolarization-activated cyclic nucleotide-gated channel 4 isoform X2 [Drosophila pseudoobscura]|uniref:Potassium/sodium hyperpolarization-activated cyclic nucleotide-gated channel 4 isoform X2 n=1 Tax=Drosophila pseudoobscura pseudoobscura TaxID=46245 RepID=A0A6I8VRK7_DROPS|nr:potassium/sodium hyperpolarization-activated cyclic nucleotide-gated channel 4 isoform X2 [Drosophila pseudoobscura]